MKQIALRSIPAVDELINHSEIVNYHNKIDTDIIAKVIRMDLQKWRELIINDEVSFTPSFQVDILQDILQHLNKLYTCGLKKVINATGVPLHTNLGRAPLSSNIKNEFNEILFGYSNLEYNIEKGERGLRHDHLKEIFQILTGAEDVLLVNNNAAAVMLTLNTIAKDKEVIVSRGELVEVGGSFRIPKIMEHSGAILREVGSTNKTHENDYESAISNETAALMKVHTSNYCIEGFTSNLSIKDLKILGRKQDLPVIEDLGSGVFVDLRNFGLRFEPTVQESIRQGADIVTFSGDKLLGGPQCGIIVGKTKYIEQMKKNQLLRALRVDKLTIAALTLTAKNYLLPHQATQNLPVLSMLSASQDDLLKKAHKLSSLIAYNKNDFQVSVVQTTELVGGGSLPGETLYGYAVAIRPIKIKINAFEKKFRIDSPHIVGRIQNEEFLLDVRTITDEEIFIIAEKAKKIMNI